MTTLMINSLNPDVSSHIMYNILGIPCHDDLAYSCELCYYICLYNNPDAVSTTTIPLALGMFRY